MTDNFGGGVSRVLAPQGTAFLQVLWQEGKPPLDSELNFLQQISNEEHRTGALRDTPSGWLGNETSLPSDFQTNPAWSNWLRFGRQRTGETQSVMWAAVNGWLIPVAGTRTGTPPGAPNNSDTTNVIALDPPPANSGDFRVDFVFLEAWVARIPPNPSTTNKPAGSAIWRYGNVEGGFAFLPDDLVDPAIGFETTQRLQLQYRIRVAKGLVGLTSNPDGFDPAIVKAQGAAASPTSFIFQNMRTTLGDPGLWRAGDGTSNALGTVDGYTYAIPIAAVFRRNGVAWSGDPSQNLNGAFNRNPLAVDRTGILTFSTVPTLASSITAAATTFVLASSSGVPLPATPAFPVLIKVGDELMTYAGITGTNVTGVIRGVNGTRAETHAAGTPVVVMSGRPDGLFSDQIASTDVLDLRHAINPNGFDYEAMLRTNLDKLVRGQLRANWKRSGAGPQGPFVAYQDKIASVGSGVALGVTRLDGADDIRMIFSDAAALQPVELIAKANGVAVPSPSNVGWSLSLTVTHTTRATPSVFSPNDVLSIPISQFKSGLPGGDADQVRFVNDGYAHAVDIRVDGQTTPVSASLYTVTPANPGPNDDLVITLGPSFPATGNQLYITAHVVYGAGRGLSRKPDSMHSVNYISPSTELLLQQSGVVPTNLPTRITWAPLWSKYRSAMYKNSLPSTAETYGDLGSKTVILQPFRRIVWPTEFRTMDGTSANVAPTSFTTGTVGVGAGSTTFTDASKNFVTAGTQIGDVLVVALGGAAGTYVVTAVAPGADVTKLTLATSMPVAVGVNYTLSHAQNLMPLLKADAATPKWATTDPLQLFSGTTFPTASTNNLYVTLPRHLVPGWGEVRCPILWQDAASTNFAEGVNFMCLSKKGASFTDGDKNYVPYSNGSLSYAIFSTFNFNPPGTPATYNAAFTFGGITFAGLRFFTDTRGLGRMGLELPPFYGIARLFAVYEAGDYQANGSAYNPTTRAPTGAGARNLLRQDFQGPTFWVEIDDDGDSTFIINADALDLSKSVLNPITSFASGNYVIESSIFGFDRGSFDLNHEFRLVLTRPTSTSLMRNQAVDPVRTNNVNAIINGPTSVLPGPATGTDQVVVNYSRTPYQGDAWGSQTSYSDIGYAPGPLTSGVAYQLSTTHLIPNGLTRPNQKVLEVLASVGFATTLGTGRFSGDTKNPTLLLTNAFDFRNVGYEDPTVYPPVSPIAARPRVLIDGAASGEATLIEADTAYLGATERLPLGALWRDKDFRGGSLGLGDGTAGTFVYLGNTGVGTLMAGLAQMSALEQSEAPLNAASTASGAPGDVVVHVDGEQGNYSLLVNFRTNRGGSAFTASGSHPGGEVVAAQGQIQAPAGHTNVITGRAFLVRNAPTSVGATEVSPGDELMMLVITNGVQLKDTNPKTSYIAISTNGTAEGTAAADLYRIEGHPLLTNNVHYAVDPSTIILSPRLT
jgi:hypothetical protein